MSPIIFQYFYKSELIIYVGELLPQSPFDAANLNAQLWQEVESHHEIAGTPECQRQHKAWAVEMI